jgi:hypothetical protein
MVTYMPIIVPYHHNSGCDYEMVCQQFENATQICKCIPDPNDGMYMAIVLVICAVMIIIAIILGKWLVEHG